MHRAVTEVLFWAVSATFFCFLWRLHRLSVSFRHVQDARTSRVRAEEAALVALSPRSPRKPDSPMFQPLSRRPSSRDSGASRRDSLETSEWESLYVAPGVNTPPEPPLGYPRAVSLPALRSAMAAAPPMRRTTSTSLSFSETLPSPSPSLTHSSRYSTSSMPDATLLSFPAARRRPSFCTAAAAASASAGESLPEVKEAELQLVYRTASVRQVENAALMLQSYAYDATLLHKHFRAAARSSR